MKNVVNSIKIAFQNIRANPLHTFLSTLGIVIGVAALVAVLALGDGLEETGREQIETTTSIKNIRIEPQRYQIINGIRVEIENTETFTFSDLRSMEKAIGNLSTVEISDRLTSKVTLQDSVMGVYVYGSTHNGRQFVSGNIQGSFFQEDEIVNQRRVAFTNKSLLDIRGISADEALGSTISIFGNSYQIIGVHNAENAPPSVYIPLTIMEKEIEDINPSFVVLANEIEDVIDLKAKIEHWLNDNFEQGSSAFNMQTYEGRARQFEEGILLFKLIMGAITGISVLVGGIGIMNVLLISVTERTKEIGIRKATGAKKSDIVFQFLSESVTISVLGCGIGWLAGIVGVMIFIPIVNSITDINFNAAIGAGSVAVIAIVAVLVGVIFGTYPAWRAANLTPVDAIRHE